MLQRTLAAMSLTLALSFAASAGTAGVFQGRVYQDHDAGPGWIYVQGRNGMLRKVEVSRARVVYAASVPTADRAKDPTVDLIRGAEVRVTAEQDGGGEWRASRVEILKVDHETSPRPQGRAQVGSGKTL